MPNDRLPPEQQRQQAEGLRETAEEGRQDAEQNREATEGQRSSAESGRKEAEQFRRFAEERGIRETSGYSDPRQEREHLREAGETGGPPGKGASGRPGCSTAAMDACTPRETCKRR